MKKKNNKKVILDILLTLNFCIWWLLSVLTFLVPSNLFRIVVFCGAFISSLVFAFVTYMPFVKKSNEGVNPVFGKPKPKIQANNEKELTDEEKKYRMK